MKKVIFLIAVCVGCEFRISDEDAKEDFRDNTVAISFGNLELEGRSIHYAFTNQGRDKLAVFIHGSPGSWNAFIDFFKNDTLLIDFDLLAIDRPGFGGSGFGEVERSIKAQASFMNQAIAQFEQDVKVIIGHSLGGPVAARMAMDFPENYHGMVLVAPSIDPELEEEEWFRKVIDTKVGAFFTPKEFEVSNAEIMGLKEELEEMLPLWEQIIIPTIIIQGSEDSLVPKENAAFAKRMLSDTILEVNLLEDVNHFIPWTHPQEIVDAIRKLANRK
ncbi:Pimeloyl-ACP methyl ester carboxylesterase [Ekhidna lutea]|uniref:Pimeloyl-ACP methyl ester carboxylesterase n=1 Tax=Ekhidna lutea TaxID=447679 RepID=A0A239K3E9_EKHLU|nr:alpha/beta hydrolase [Ekhidna lutea]SNT11664.1 Pimeloyl-ACP methyl ester carboxylesterase [Ekhidna lutea]